MTQTSEPMLKPGELRKAPTFEGPGWTVEVQCVAGGSFTQVVVRNARGIRTWSRNFQYDTDALRTFAQLKA